MRSLKKVIVAVAATGLLAVGGVVPAAIAAGAGGGDFTCTQSGVPGWGYVHSKYNHPDKTHYATAKGKGYQTITKPKGQEAHAQTGRSISDNYCYWGTS